MLPDCPAGLRAAHLRLDTANLKDEGVARSAGVIAFAAGPARAVQKVI
jgi:hypothetical protein